MKILVTGSKGFIGKNLIAELKNQNMTDIYEYDVDSNVDDLVKFTQDCEIIFHLAGINRPTDESEFIKGNYGFTSTLLNLLQKHNNKCPIVLSSSIQAELDNPYGKSKKAGEDLLFQYSFETNSRVIIYRFTNVFGKWCKPNYNSVIATFCHNINNDLPILINNPNAILNLIYIDDLVAELIKSITGDENRRGNFCYVEPTYSINLRTIADLLYSFKNSRMDLSIPNTEDEFTKKLYATYLSYIPHTSLSYNLKMNIDSRGSFTEFLKTNDRGQLSINISKPGIIKGNHWHMSKNEKFLVVSGKGVIRLRKIDENQVIEHFVSGDSLQVVDIPPGYTHNIENLGTSDMVTVIWVNEIFDPAKPDTYYMEVD